MSTKYENFNGYEGNGWSKYQIMVLQQLDDHNTLLQNMNRELNELRQTVAVSEMELKMWRAQTMATIQSLEEDANHILYDEKGISYKLSSIERELDIEEQSRTKWKATLALYGSVIVFLLNIIIQVFALYFKG